jgi:hypothetical protein
VIPSLNKTTYYYYYYYYYYYWFQFADDVAVISGQESEKRFLLNRLTIWCQWADMIIRVDKCSTFGIKKAITKSVQYLPKLIINNDLVPRVKSCKSFWYLGGYFDFEMSNQTHKSELTTLIIIQRINYYCIIVICAF